MLKVCNNISLLQSFLRALLILISLVHIKAEWSTGDYLKREHSLYKPYHGVGMTVPYWDFQGSTMVTKNYIRLTPDTQSAQGALWNNVPCNVRNWELQIQFKIHGRGKDLFGDGMAIWYAKDRMESGSVFGNMDYFVGLAVIIDTYSNHNGEHNHMHPYISAMINNGTLHYDHDRDGTHTQLAGCEAQLRNLQYDTHISIRYDHDVLTVSTEMENKAIWKECLSVKGVLLPTGYYLGLSAATGDLSDNHDVLSVRFFELDMPGDPKEDEDRAQILPSASFFEPPREHIEDPKPASWSGVKTFLLMFVAAIGMIVLIIFGITIYQKHQENQRKRFY